MHIKGLLKIIEHGAKCYFPCFHFTEPLMSQIFHFGSLVAETFQLKRLPENRSLLVGASKEIYHQAIIFKLFLV